MSWDLQGLLERVVDAEDTTQALERACGIVRDRLQATGAWVHAASAHVLSRAGTASARRVDAVVARALATGRSARTPIEGIEVRDGLDASAGPPRRRCRCAAAARRSARLSCAWDGEPRGRSTARRAAPPRRGDRGGAARAPARRGARRRVRARPAPATRWGCSATSEAMRALRARVRARGARRRSTCSSTARAARARSWSRARIHARRAAPARPFVHGELRRAHRRAARGRAVRPRAGRVHRRGRAIGPGCSRRRTAARCSSTRSGSYRRARRRSSCACSRTARCGASARAHARRVDVRVVAATQPRLEDEVEAGRFRADLRYRLEVVRIALAAAARAARRRPRAGPRVLADAAAQGRRARRAHPAALAALARYRWPGNIRELQNVVRALAVNGPRRGPGDAGGAAAGADRGRAGRADARAWLGAASRSSWCARRWRVPAIAPRWRRGSSVCRGRGCASCWSASAST